MTIAELFAEAPDLITNMSSSLSKAAPWLILIMIIIGVLYWIRSFQKSGRTEIRVYRRP